MQSIYKYIIVALLPLACTTAGAQNIKWVQKSNYGELETYAVSFSEDGGKVLSGSECHPAYMRVFGTGDGAKQWEYKIEGSLMCVQGVKLSGNGKWAAAMEELGNLLIFDYSLATPALVHTIPTGTTYAFALDFSPNGEKIATGCSNKKLVIYNAASGAVVKSIEAHANWIMGVDWSSDNKIATGGDDKLVKIWDENGNLLHTLSGHGSSVTGVKFSADGKYLASSSRDKTLKIWDATSGTLLKTLAGHTGDVMGVDFSDDGAKVVSGSKDGTIRTWDVATGSQLTSFSKAGSGMVYAVDFSPNGQYVAAGTENGDVQLWDLQFPAGVADFGSKAEIQAYPNPFTGSFTITLDDAASLQDVFLMDAAGRRVKCDIQRQGSVIQCHAPHIAAGIYQLLIATGEGTITGRVVKQ